jgi:hypothetical protein
MAAAFLPFPTAVLAQALHESDTAERVAIVLYGSMAIVIELLLRAAIQYARAHPELTTDGAVGEAAPEPVATEPRGWRAWVGSLGYALAILLGILIFPKLAALGYLLVALRGVLVSGNEGKLSIRWLRTERD